MKAFERELGGIWFVTFSTVIITSFLEQSKNIFSSSGERLFFLQPFSQMSMIYFIVFNKTMCFCVNISIFKSSQVSQPKQTDVLQILVNDYPMFCSPFLLKKILLKKVKSRILKRDSKSISVWFVLCRFDSSIHPTCWPISTSTLAPCGSTPGRWWPAR